MDYPHLRMAAGAHDRSAVHRRDDAWLEEKWADPDSRVLVVAGTRIHPEDGAVPWVASKKPITIGNVRSPSTSLR